MWVARESVSILLLLIVVIPVPALRHCNKGVSLPRQC